MRGGRRTDHDFQREIESHLDLETDRLTGDGVSLADARAAARRTLGNVTKIQEEFYESRRVMWFHDLIQDAVYALRTFRRERTFAVVAILTLALGIAATTVTLSVVRAVLLKPLPYPESDRLINIVETVPASATTRVPVRRMSMNRQEFLAWRSQTQTLTQMAGVLTPPITLMSTTAGTVRLSGAVVSPHVFDMLRAKPMLGRLFDSDDDTPAAAKVILSARAWQQYFQSQPDILGRTISLRSVGPETGLLDGRPLDIVGVMPTDFAFPSPQIEFWVPLVATAAAQDRMSFGNVFARLRDGVSIDGATQEANVIGPSIRPAPPNGPAPAAVTTPPRFQVVGVKDQMVATARPALQVLAASAGVVLLIVCVNVANLLLARGTARKHELAVRFALGADRPRIVRQLLTESLLLTAGGGLLGTLLAVGGIHLVRSAATITPPGIFQLALPPMFPRMQELGVDLHVLSLSMALSALAAILFGIAPALQLARRDALSAIRVRAASGGRDASRTDTRMRNSLVTAQMALATALLIGAALLITSFVKLGQVNPGYDAARLLTFYLVVPPEYPTNRKVALVDDLIQALHGIPGVEAAGFTYAGPLLAIRDQIGVFVPEGRTIEEMRGNPFNPQIRSVSHRYLQTMGVRLVAGRWLTERDDASAPPVLIINRTAAQHFFGSTSPIGLHVRLDGRMEQPPQEIVGVVDDMRQAGVDEDPAPQMFVDFRQVLALSAARGMTPAQQERLALGFSSFAVRTGRDPEHLISSVRSTVSRLDGGLGIDAISPMARLVEMSLARQRFYALLLGAFASLATVLAVVGIYGVQSFTVLQRTREIAIRRALGASRGGIIRLVLGRSTVLTAIGIGLGLIGATIFSRYLAGLLFGLTPLDAPTYVLVPAAFALVATVAAYMPARSAATVSPLSALHRD